MVSPVLGWFDQLEHVLESEAKLAGLLEHGATVGQAREFLVTRVLRTILPSSVHIGAGMVIDTKGAVSKQIDIVIYDPRFPLLKIEGGGLYFAEGVLATIEVKSTIDCDGLRNSLENCESVLRLNVNGGHVPEKDARVQIYAQQEGITTLDAEYRFGYRLRPATYVFAFNSKLATDTVATEIGKWWEEKKCAFSAYFPLLPRVLVAGKTVGVVNDGWFRLTGSTDDPSANQKNPNNEPNSN